MLAVVGAGGGVIAGGFVTIATDVLRAHLIGVPLVDGVLIMAIYSYLTPTDALALNGVAGNPVICMYTCVTP